MEIILCENLMEPAEIEIYACSNVGVTVNGTQNGIESTVMWPADVCARAPHRRTFKLLAIVYVCVCVL